MIGSTPSITRFITERSIYGTVFHVKHKPKGRIAVKIVAMETLASQKSKSLVQLHGGCVGHFGLKSDLASFSLTRLDYQGRFGAYLVSFSSNHGVNGHADQFGSDTFSTMLFFDSQHGNIAPKRSVSVRLEFGDYDAKQVI